jgi:hypothetical protein
MRVPSEDEFAAIAAAYTLVRSEATPAATTPAPGWRLAARIGSRDWAQLRAVARASRWNARGRLDD